MGKAGISSGGVISTGGRVGGSVAKISVGGPEGGSRFSFSPAINKAPSFSSKTSKYGTFATRMSSEPLGSRISLDTKFGTTGKFAIGTAKRTEIGLPKVTPKKEVTPTMSVDRVRALLAQPNATVAELQTPNSGLTKNETNMLAKADSGPVWTSLSRISEMPKVEPLHQPKIKPLSQPRVESYTRPTTLPEVLQTRSEVSLRSVVNSAAVRQQAEHVSRVKPKITAPKAEQRAVVTKIEPKKEKTKANEANSYMRIQLQREALRADRKAASLPVLNTLTRKVELPSKPQIDSQHDNVMTHVNFGEAVIQHEIEEEEKKRLKRLRALLQRTTQKITGSLQKEKVLAVQAAPKQTEPQKQAVVAPVVTEQTKVLTEVKVEAAKLPTQAAVELVKETKQQEIVVFQAQKTDEKKKQEEKVRLYRPPMKNRLRKWREAIAQTFPFLDSTTTKQIKEIAEKVKHDRADDSHESLLQGKIDGSSQGPQSYIAKLLTNEAEVNVTAADLVGQIAIDEVPTGIVKEEGSRELKDPEVYIITQTGQKNEYDLAS